MSDGTDMAANIAITNDLNVADEVDEEVALNASDEAYYASLEAAEKHPNEILRVLNKLDACDRAKKWTVDNGVETVRDAWEKCQTYFWMDFAIGASADYNASEDNPNAKIEINSKEHHAQIRIAAGVLQESLGFFRAMHPDYFTYFQTGYGSKEYWGCWRDLAEVEKLCYQWSCGVLPEEGTLGWKQLVAPISEPPTPSPLNKCWAIFTKINDDQESGKIHHSNQLPITWIYRMLWDLSIVLCQPEKAWNAVSNLFNAMQHQYRGYYEWRQNSLGYYLGSPAGSMPDDDISTLGRHINPNWERWYYNEGELVRSYSKWMADFIRRYMPDPPKLWDEARHQ